MNILVNSAEMRALDRHSIDDIGIPSMVLMERAALTVTEELIRRRPGKLNVVVFAGTGNNGADGLAAARMLALDGHRVRVVVTGNRAHATEEWTAQFEICGKLNIPVTEEIPDPDAVRRDRVDVLVDAMMGTGLSRPVAGKSAEVISLINESDAYVVSVDIPSGISSDTGAVMGCAVRADLTVTFEVQKTGLALYPGAEYAGECIVRSIGIVTGGMPGGGIRRYTLSAEDLSLLPKRPPLSNKGTFGRVLLIAGSRNMAGAAVLAGEAAGRSGAGLVCVFTPECNRVILQSALPEAILAAYGEDEDPVDLLAERIKWAGAVVIGPGLGTGPSALRILTFVLSHCEVPLVLDADALNLLSEHRELLTELSSRCILTPHLGELSRLTGMSVPEIRRDLTGSAVSYAKAHNICLVQKDARTIVVPADGSFCYVNTCGNSGMATGGSGDVLSGVIGGLLASGMKPDQAAVFGVLMHSVAGDRAAAAKGERAVLAGDIAGELR